MEDGKLEFDELANLMFKVKGRLEETKVLSLFVDQGKHFEGWLQVELCDVLYRYGIKPHKETHYPFVLHRRDIEFDGWVIEIKHSTGNLKKVVRDVGKLRDKESRKRLAVFFIIIPSAKRYKENIEAWKREMLDERDDLKRKLKGDLQTHYFTIDGKRRGLMCAGLVR